MGPENAICVCDTICAYGIRKVQMAYEMGICATSCPRKKSLTERELSPLVSGAPVDRGGEVGLSGPAFGGSRPTAAQGRDALAPYSRRATRARPPAASEPSEATTTRLRSRYEQSRSLGIGFVKKTQLHDQEIGDVSSCSTAALHRSLQ